MSDGNSRFTSDRRTPREASWKTDADWTAGIAENVDVTATRLVGRAPLSSGTPPDSGVSRWGLEQELTDQWGNNAGTAFGGEFTETAAVGNYAYSFRDGEYIDVGVLPLTGSISIAAWLYPTDVSTQGHAFSNYGGNDNGEDHFLLGIGAGSDTDPDQPVFFIDAGIEGHQARAPSVSANSYYHLTGVFDEAASEIRIYVDGALGGTASWSRSTPDWQQRQTQLGAPPGGSEKFVYNGHLDDPRAYNKALSDTEVQNLYTTGRIYS